MKEKLTRNIGLKVLSIILAAILWLVITNVDDPVVTKPFFDVPVKIINDTEITDRDLVYDIIEGKTIDFTVAARRSIKEKLTVSDFTVTADFSKLSEVNAVTINIYSPRYGSEVTVTEGKYQMMKVELEELAEKPFKVNVVQKGEPADGYYVAKKTAKTILKVKGPKSKIERIAQIVVEVDVSDMAESFRTPEEPKALDEEGNEIDASNLNFSDTSITVDIGMYRTKDIDLIITPTGKPANGYYMMTPDYEPKTIEVAGTYEALYSIINLTIEENIDGASANIDKEINIQEQLPEGIILVGDNQTAVVNIPIVKADTKDVVIWPEDLEQRNKPDGMLVAYQNIGPIALKVSGPADEIEDATVKTLKPYIDLSNYSSGTYDITIGINASDNVTLTNNPKVRVLLNH